MNDASVDFPEPCIFAFESDLERTLICIPMAVRFKLDCCGVKLSLDQWRKLAEGDRRRLLKSPCETDVELAAFKRVLEEMVKAATGDEARSCDAGTRQPWTEADVPAQVQHKTRELGAAPPTAEQWRALSPLQRFVLLKLSRDGDHHRNLIPALREFHLHA